MDASGKEPRGDYEIARQLSAEHSQQIVHIQRWVEQLAIRRREEAVRQREERLSYLHGPHMPPRLINTTTTSYRDDEHSRQIDADVRQRVIGTIREDAIARQQEPHPSAAPQIPTISNTTIPNRTADRSQQIIDIEREFLGRTVRRPEQEVLRLRNYQVVDIERDVAERATRRRLISNEHDYMPYHSAPHKPATINNVFKISSSGVRNHRIFDIGRGVGQDLGEFEATTVQERRRSYVEPIERDFAERAARRQEQEALTRQHEFRLHSSAPSTLSNVSRIRYPEDVRNHRIFDTEREFGQYRGHPDAGRCQQIVDMERDFAERAARRQEQAALARQHELRPQPSAPHMPATFTNVSRIRYPEDVRNHRIFEVEVEATSEQEEHRSYLVPTRFVDSSTIWSSDHGPGSTIGPSNSSINYPYGPPATPERNLSYLRFPHQSKDDGLPSYDEAIALHSNITAVTTRRF